MHKNMSRTSLKLLLGLVFVGLFFSKTASAADGKAIFKANCSVCHYVDKDQILTGPGLKGLFDRIPAKPTKEEWLHKWIKNATKVKASGDPYATALDAKFPSGTMSEFEFLSDEDINLVIAYIKAPPADKVVSTTTTTTGGPVVEEPKGIDPLYIIFAVIAILAILISILRGVRQSLKNVVNRKEGKEEEPTLTFWEDAKNWMAGNRRFIGVCCIIVVLLGMRGCWNSLWTVGVYYDEQTKQGYKPEQPIKFSHKLHAGDNGIACQYCHNSVEKSRHAGIPTVNVCMNCHKAIQTGPQYAEKEISKIYAAAGFNPKTATYDQPQNPIKWIKVHNLPDHVYFNHSQHVVVGKQECATCHGNVKEMTVAEQQSPLTMGWCVDCHRKTEVAMEGNAYYDKLHKFLKEKYKDQHLKKFTVAQMGGLECAKCHY